MKNLAQAISAAIIGLAICMYAAPASAVDADVAKKCRALAIKAHPTPKAGTKAGGAEKAQRDYFQTCLTKADKEEKSGK
jgi:hypothetical protein